MPSIQLPGPALPGPISSSVRERWAFWLIIALGLVHGLIYVFLVPPWQHSDEPSHFEHAWLIAANRRLPVSGEFDPEMRRAVFDSMAAHQFFVGIGYDPSPDAFWASARSQVSEPPAYYLLAAGPLAAIPLDSVDGQLRLVRILSLGLYIATIGAAYGILRSLTRPGHWLRLMVPFSMAALPGLANLMTSVNNDVLAVAALSFFIWPAGLLIVEGFSWRRAVAAGALALLCAGAKSTALVAVPLLAVALLFSLLRGPRRRLAWGALAAAGLLGLGLAAGWGDAAQWHRATSQAEPTRTQTGLAPLGSYAFALDSSARRTPAWLDPLAQPISIGAARQLAGEWVTLGAWIWASAPAEAFTPTLHDGTQAARQRVSVSTTPAFFASHIPVDPQSGHIWVSLDAGANPADPVAVYYDGIVLAKGRLSPDKPPVFSSDQGEGGVWGSTQFTNLLSNPSAEAGGPRVRALIDDLGARLLPDESRPSLLLTTGVDPAVSGWYYPEAALNLLRGFWAKFGWGHVALAGSRPYRLLAAACLLGAVGVLAHFWRKRSGIRWALVAWFGSLLAVVWGAALLRGASFVFADSPFLPAARYAYPAVIPTLLALNLGWLEGFRRISGKIQVKLGFFLGAFGVVFLALATLAIYSIAGFYYLW